MTNVNVDLDLRELMLHELGQIAPEADYDSLDPAADIRSTLEIDSFDFLNFLIALDTRLGIETPEADYGKLNSLDDLVTYFSARLK